MSNLTVTIQETVVLPNNNIETAVNTKIIAGVNQVMRRTDTIVSYFSGSGQQILAFVDSEAQQVAGSFVRDTVKYIRITNLDSINSCDIYLVQTNEDETLFLLDAGKSLMFPNAYFDSSDAANYVVGDYVDQLYYSNFSTLDSIMAKATTGSVQIEYLVASS
jgi:hypothetical protein